MTKIDVISGFLGAGKTTFIRKLLSEALEGEKVVLIENEFGEIGIDGGFLKDFGIEIKEMSQGCICCSLSGDFEKSLKEVIAKYSPDRVIIEPSGVGKLSDVMKAVTDASESLDVVLNSAVTAVDAAKCRMYMKNFGEFFNNQIQYAGTIVLTRTDVSPQEKIDQSVELIRTVNQTAEIITTPVSELSGEKLLTVIEKRDDMLEDLRRAALFEPDGEDEDEHGHAHHDSCREGEGGHCHDHGHSHAHEDEDGHDHGYSHGDRDDHHHSHGHSHSHGHGDGHGHHHHGHDADEVFESVGETNVAPISKEMLEKALKKLSGSEEFGTVLRAKGMIKSSGSDTWYHFDLTPGEYEIRDGEPDYTGKLCVIGSGLKEDEIKILFGIGGK